MVDDLDRTRETVRQGFDPGGSLPADCEEWAVPYLAAVDRLLAHVETLTQERDRLICVIDEVEEREARLCPEGATYEQHIADVQQQLDVLKPGGSYAWKQRAEQAELDRDEARSERDELSKRFDDLTELRLLKAGPSADNAFALEMASELWPHICNALACWFVEKGGKNYVEFKAEYQPKATLTGKAPQPVGTFVVTMQRLLGKSPNDLRLESEQRAEQAERERDEARANYQFMVNRAAGNNLQHYRELGATAAEALNQADTLRAERDRLQVTVDTLSVRATEYEADRDRNADLWEEMKAERDRLQGVIDGLRAEVQTWAEQIARSPGIMVKTPFEALSRVLAELDRLLAAPSRAPRRSEHGEAPT